MSAEKEKTKKLSLLPRWGWVAVAILVAIWIVVGTTREARLRAGAIRMLNGADVRLVAKEGDKPILDGYTPYYGHVVLMNNHRSYDKLLGYCSTKTERATEVFRAVIQNGTWEGKALACHMAFYLMQEGVLTREDLDAMVALLGDSSADLRRVAQREIGYLLVIRKTSTVKDYEQIGAPPPELKTPFSAKVEDTEMPVTVEKATPAGGWKRMRWSCPEACLAWWKAYGAKVKWNPEIGRFAIAD